MSERITAMDIEKQEFRRKMRGFDEEDVRLYLKSVAEEIERLNLENGVKQEEIAQLKGKLADLESKERALQDALVAAQRLSEEMLKKSQAEAEVLLQQARMRADGILQQSQEQLARIEDEIGRAQLERDSFEKQLRSLVGHHLELLDLRSAERLDPGTGIRVFPMASSSEPR